jgi:hypothetical protein
MYLRHVATDMHRSEHSRVAKGELVLSARGGRNDKSDRSDGGQRKETFHRSSFHGSSERDTVSKPGMPSVYRGHASLREWLRAARPAGIVEKYTEGFRRPLS